MMKSNMVWGGGKDVFISVTVLGAILAGGILLRPQTAHALFGRDKQQLEQAETRAKQAEGGQAVLQTRIQELERQYAQLSQEQQQLRNDRDNLLAQLTRYQTEYKDYDQVRAERDLLQQILKKAAEEERLLRDDVVDLENRLHEVQQALEQVAHERASLTGQLAQAKKRSRETQLTQENSAQRKENAELNRVLSAARRELAESQKREAGLQKRLRDVQEDHTAALADISKLRSTARTVPKDVSRMAREHERLIKENADMHYNLGVLFSENKQFSRALSEFRKVVELRPDDADAYYNLGIIYAEHLPDREKAMAHFKRYLQINPGAKDSGWVKQYIASWRAWEAEDRLE